MTENWDAVVIGGGIIGCAIAYELAKGGRRVACVEKNAVAGSGSTCNSCAIIRTHYSTLNGAALAKSNYPFWEDWPGYLGAGEGETLATYREVGCCYTCFESNGYGRKLEDIANELDIPYEVWTPAKMRAHLPIMSPGHFHPVKTTDDPAFGERNGEMRYVLFFPKAGYINDPMLATQNLQAAAKRHGAAFMMGERVMDVLKGEGRAAGVALESGRTLHAPVVVNAAGPHSYKVNDMAGVTEGMNIRTRALRVEVAHVPSPEGFDFEANGLICSDADIGGYWRPEIGNKILVGSEEPECDPLDWVDPDDYDTEVTDQARLQALRAAQRFPAMGVPTACRASPTFTTRRTTGSRSTITPTSRGSSWPSERVETSCKNAPVVGMMMAALVDYVASGNDHDARPFQYALPNMDFALDMSFCSRKREINRESSFSVVG